MRYLVIILGLVTALVLLLLSVLAYLVTRHGMTLDQAREQVRRHRCWDRCCTELFCFTR